MQYAMDLDMTMRWAVDAATDLLTAVRGRRFACVLADPPWQFINRTGKVAPEHRRLSRYGTMDSDAISSLPVAEIALRLLTSTSGFPTLFCQKACR